MISEKDPGAVACSNRCSRRPGGKNDEWPFRFAIDTGAWACSFRAPKNPSDGHTGARLDKTVFRSLRVGTIDLRDVHVTRSDYNTSRDLPHINGNLTFGFFVEYLLTLHYPARRVRIEKGRLSRADGAEIIEMRPVKGLPALDIRVGVETGNYVSNSLPPGEHRLPIAFSL